MVHGWCIAGALAGVLHCISSGAARAETKQRGLKWLHPCNPPALFSTQKQTNKQKTEKEKKKLLRIAQLSILMQLFRLARGFDVSGASAGTNITVFAEIG